LDRCGWCRKKIAVVGVGNILMGDEGVGIEVVKRLEELPGIGAGCDCIEIIDAGSGFLNIVSGLREYDKIIIVDAVHGGEAPGTVYRFRFEDVEGRRAPDLSLHDFGVFESIQLERLVAPLPEDIVFYGVEPHSVRLSMELSDVVGAKVGYVVERIVEELNGRAADSGKEDHSGKL
jgi:hydrogenase maturation protease